VISKPMHNNGRKCPSEMDHGLYRAVPRVHEISRKWSHIKRHVLLDGLQSLQKSSTHYPRFTQELLSEFITRTVGIAD